MQLKNRFKNKCLMKKTIIFGLAVFSFAVAYAGSSKMAEMSARLDKLDKLDFDEAVEKANACTAQRDFECTEKQLKRAKSLAHTAEDNHLMTRAQQAMADEVEQIAAEKRAAEEYARQQRLEEERQREEQERIQQEVAAESRRRDEAFWADAMGGLVQGYVQGKQMQEEIKQMQMAEAAAKYERQRQEAYERGRQQQASSAAANTQWQQQQERTRQQQAEYQRQQNDAYQQRLAREKQQEENERWAHVPSADATHCVLRVTGNSGWDSVRNTCSQTISIHTCYVSGGQTSIDCGNGRGGFDDNVGPGQTVAVMSNAPGKYKLYAFACVKPYTAKDVNYSVGGISGKCVRGYGG